MRKLLVSIVFAVVSLTTFAQVGVGTTTIDASAMLDVTATDKGLLLPRVANTSVITAPADGLMVYDISSKCVKSFQNGTWSNCFRTPPLILIGLEADDPDIINSAITVEEIASIPGITGVVPANETAYQDYIDANPTLFSSPATVAEVQAMVDAIAAIPVVPTVTTPTGKIWMDRNLGASQVATSSTDAASYGDLYQWGRSADGHQLRTSGVISTISTGPTPGHGNFITSTSATNQNWADYAGEDDLWQAGLNDPCPSGFRIPTQTEWDLELTHFPTLDVAGAFASILKLPSSGYRYRLNGDVRAHSSTVGSPYHSSTIIGTNMIQLNITNTNASTLAAPRGHGQAVRCIKE